MPAPITAVSNSPPASAFQVGKRGRSSVDATHSDRLTSCSDPTRSDYPGRQIATPRSNVPLPRDVEALLHVEGLDRKSTRLNSSHTVISYAVFCLKKKKKIKNSYSSK